MTGMEVDSKVMSEDFKGSFHLGDFGGLC